MTEPSNLRDCPLCGGYVWPEDEASYVAKIEAATIAKVVAWLRKEAPAVLHDPRMVASAIEAGEWKP